MKFLELTCLTGIVAPLLLHWLGMSTKLCLVLIAIIAAALAVAGVWNPVLWLGTGLALGVNLAALARTPGSLSGLWGLLQPLRGVACGPKKSPPQSPAWMQALVQTLQMEDQSEAEKLRRKEMYVR